MDTSTTSPHSTVSAADEQAFLLDTVLDQDELTTLLDSAFVFSDSTDPAPDTRSTVVDTVMTRIQECSHGQDHRLRLRCAITDAELDALDAAAAEVNPSSLHSTLSRLRREATSVNSVYSLDLYAPTELRDLLETADQPWFQALYEGSSIQLPRFNGEGIQVRTYLRTYLTEEEMDGLENYASDDEDAADLAKFSDSLVEVATQFDPHDERVAFVDEVSV